MAGQRAAAASTSAQARRKRYVHTTLDHCAHDTRDDALQSSRLRGVISVALGACPAGSGGFGDLQRAPRRTRRGRHHGVCPDPAAPRTPCFRPVDFHLFSADITDFFGLLTGPKGILPEPEHQFHPELGVGPGVPHDPPYNREIKAGLARLGIADQVRFAPEDFQLPKAILFGFMALPLDQPGCPRGSSPDFAEGPIIPNLLFPANPEPESVLVSRTTFFRRGEVFDPAFILDIRRLDRITPPLAVDGQSHLPVFLATTADFGPGGAIEGPYTIHSVVVDHAGNGWDMTVQFEIR